MLREIYKNDSVDKIALIIFEDQVFSNSNIREDVTFSENVNAGTDFVIGSTYAGQLCFNLLDINSYTVETDLIDKEFAYKIGANTETTSVYSAYKQARQEMFLSSGRYWYGGNQKGTVLTAWRDAEGKLEQLSLPEQPIQAVESLFIWEGNLYCGHSTEPYVSAYKINDDGSLNKFTVSLTPLQQFQIMELNRYRKVFRYEGNLIYCYEKVRSSGSVTDYLELKYEFTQLGIFIPKSVIKKDDRVLTVTAYDRMVYFDCTADYVVNNQSYPVTVLDLLQSLCAFLGVGLNTSTFLNSNYLVQKNVKTQNITGRQILQWIAEAAARFARMTPDGKLELQWYGDIEYSIDASHGGPTEYSKITVADYITKKVDKLQIKVTQNDVGVVVPADDPERKNAYIIQNNPIFYAETDAELRPTAEKLFDAIKDFQYVPFSLTCKGNPLVRAGDAFSLTSTKGQSIRALVMAKKMNGVKALTDDLSATGNAERAVQSNAINQSIQQLRGSVHELVLNIEEFRSTITNYQLETDESLRVLKSDIQQTSSEIALRVEKTIYDKDMTAIDEHIASLELSLKGLFISIDTGKLEFTSGGLKTYYEQGEFAYSLKFADGELRSSKKKIIGTEDQYEDGEVSIKGSEIKFYFNGHEGASIKGVDFPFDDSRKELRIEGYVNELNVKKLKFSALYEVTAMGYSDAEEERLYPHIVKNINGKSVVVYGYTR